MAHTHKVKVTYTETVEYVGTVELTEQEWQDYREWLTDSDVADSGKYLQEFLLSDLDEGDDWWQSRLAGSSRTTRRISDVRLLTAQREDLDG